MNSDVGVLRLTENTTGSSWAGMGYRRLLVEQNEGGELLPGSMVKLRSGGPRMEVERKREDGYLECIWMDKHHEVHRDAFYPAMLKTVGGILG